MSSSSSFSSANTTFTGALRCAANRELSAWRLGAGAAVRLVNTAAVRQYEGLKHAGDEHDAFWRAHMMRLGILPTGYIYPKSGRGLRDLARQRMRLVQHRSSLISFVQNQVWRSTAVRLRGGTV